MHFNSKYVKVDAFDDQCVTVVSGNNGIKTVIGLSLVLNGPLDAI